MSVLEAAPDTVLDRTRSAGRSARLVIVGASATAIHTPLMEYAVATVYTTVHVRHGAERQAALDKSEQLASALLETGAKSGRSTSKKTKPKSTLSRKLPFGGLRAPRGEACRKSEKGMALGYFVVTLPQPVRLWSPSEYTGGLPRTQMPRWDRSSAGRRATLEAASSSVCLSKVSFLGRPGVLERGAGEGQDSRGQRELESVGRGSSSQLESCALSPTLCFG